MRAVVCAPVAQKSVSRTERYKMAEINDRADESLTTEMKKEVAERVEGFETASAKKIAMRIYTMLGKPFPLTKIEKKVVEGLRQLEEKMATQDTQDEPNNEIDDEQHGESNLETTESDKDSAITVISKPKKALPKNLSADDGVSGATAQQPTEIVFSPRQMRQEDCSDFGDPFHERSIYIERPRKGLIQPSSYRGRLAYR